MKTLILSITLALAPLAQAADTYRAATFALGTEVEMKVVTDSRDAAGACYQIFNDETRRLENLLSAYIEESDISRLKASEGHWIEVSRDTYEILQASRQASEQSHGAFDITVGALVKLWSVDQKEARVPGAEEIRSALKNVDFRKVETKQEKDQYFARLAPGQQITVGAIGKGFISDKVIDKMKAGGCSNILINYGGNVYAVGKNGSGQLWKIGLQQPDQKRGSYFAAVSVRDESVVTSGDYEKYFIRNGVKYHHILDPRTGDPVPATLSSVTIISRSSTFADAMCTALFVMGWKESIAYLSKHPEIQAVLINEQLDTAAYSESLAKRLTWTDPRFKREIIRPAAENR
jgi:thiamine biosynthesis lipoprotein